MLFLINKPDFFKRYKNNKSDLFNPQIQTIEEGDRRQDTGDRRKITWGFSPQVMREHRVDGGVLNPQRK